MTMAKVWFTACIIHRANRKWRSTPRSLWLSALSGTPWVCLCREHLVTIQAKPTDFL